MNAIDRHRMDEQSRDMLRQHAEGMLRVALHLQGPAALACDRQHAALHEAGHAVAHHVAGDRIRSVRVFERDGAWLGFTSAGRRWAVGEDTDPAEDLKHAITHLAGPMAELVLSGRPALAAGVDEIALAQGISGTAAMKLQRDPEALWTEVMVQTMTLLRDHERPLREIARRLMRKRKIPGETVVAILRSHKV